MLTWWARSACGPLRKQIKGEDSNNSNRAQETGNRITGTGSNPTGNPDQVDKAGSPMEAKGTSRGTNKEINRGTSKVISKGTSNVGKEVSGQIILTGTSHDLQSREKINNSVPVSNIRTDIR